MANTRSARKRIRANEAKHQRNRAVRSSVRTVVGKARRALLSPVDGVDPTDALRVALSALDRAAEKGVLHANNARRRKSRLASMAASLQRAEGSGEAAAARSTAAGGAKGRSSKPAASRSRAKSSAKSPAAKPSATKRSTVKPSTTAASAAKSSTSRGGRGGAKR